MPTSPSPWSTLTSRRFGRNVHECTMTLLIEDSGVASATVPVPSLLNGPFALTTDCASSSHTFTDASAHIVPPTTLCTVLNDMFVATTIISPPVCPRRATHTRWRACACSRVQVRQHSFSSHRSGCSPWAGTCSGRPRMHTGLTCVLTVSFDVVEEHIIRSPDIVTTTVKCVFSQALPSL
ncbi:hypothetical protein C8Q80DRAFT_1145752 [Daedaleopsis nitida]|nr:hypothetical protein C8Q80DRAFT_1145752 [Daedaleopsis nitida]